MALRNATTYADFLDRIEPAEHVYHADDVPAWLDRAAATLAAGAPATEHVHPARWLSS